MMTRFEHIQKSCNEALEKYKIADELNFQVGYYKAQVASLCIDVEYLHEEIEFLEKEIRELKRELA